MEAMKSPRRSLLLWLPVILVGLMGGCSSGGHSTASRQSEPSYATALSHPAASSEQIYLAQAPGACWNSMSCCIQNHPLTFVEKCGADPLEAARILLTLEQTGGNMRTEPATMAVQDGAEAAGEGAKVDDFANNEHLPGWKQECIRNYVACQTEPNWQGPCYACLRRCEGQQDWPFGMCWPRGQKGQ